MRLKLASKLLLKQVLGIAYSGTHAIFIKNDVLPTIFACIRSIHFSFGYQFQHAPLRPIRLPIPALGHSAKILLRSGGCGNCPRTTSCVVKTTVLLTLSKLTAIDFHLNLTHPSTVFIPRRRDSAQKRGGTASHNYDKHPKSNRINTFPALPDRCRCWDCPARDVVLCHVLVGVTQSAYST